MAELFDLWRKLNCAPFHFPMDEAAWNRSMYTDIDSDGRTLFDTLETKATEDALIQYGRTAFGFGESGDISDAVHYQVIRMLCFTDPTQGQQLLDQVMASFDPAQRIYAFFHYFGMSACGRHGKLHESEKHVEALLFANGFTVEHENVYYSRTLHGNDPTPETVSLHWKTVSSGNCREFAAVSDGTEIGWGQIHFLPQGQIAYLRWIYIDSNRQHQGLGTAVMQALFSELYKMGIHRFDTDTALDNITAQHYYEKNGFMNRGRTRSYYTK